MPLIAAPLCRDEISRYASVQRNPSGPAARCQELSEHRRSAKSRSYQMRKRAEQIDQTRQRIIDAAVHLHGTVGPAETTIAGIAREAGTTRLTVYRHFADEEAIFAACSAHWLSRQVPPKPGEWVEIADPIERVRVGLTDLYRFYRDGESMLTRIHRDLAALPSAHRHIIVERDHYHRDVLLDPFPAGAKDRRLQAVLAHAVSFGTWRSLCIDNKLSDSEAVEAITALVAGTAATTAAARPSRR
jgi:AcrR family transcriptional regulator